MTSPTNRRTHPARRARAIATIVTSGVTIALVAMMGITRHPTASAAGTAGSTDGPASADGLQTGQADQTPPAYPDAAVPGYPAQAPHSRTHGS